MQFAQQMFALPANTETCSIPLNSGMHSFVASLRRALQQMRHFTLADRCSINMVHKVAPKKWNTQVTLLRSQKAATPSPYSSIVRKLKPPLPRQTRPYSLTRL